MNLQRAIDNLATVPSRYAHILDDETLDAVKLGIEALKRLNWYRKYHRIDADTPLPSETED